VFRFPYAQSYHQKKVTTLAPDFLVFINGEITVPVCRECGRKGNINDDITNVTVSLGLDAGSGTASFDLATPRHAVNQYVRNGEPVFGPMSEVEIFMKGRFLSATNPEPKYYQVFWGLVSSFSESYSDGTHTLSINCKDILRWWELMVINVHPAAIAPQYFPKEQPGVGKPARYYGHNPYSIIYSLAQTMGTIQHLQGLNLGITWNTKRPEEALKKDFTTIEDTRASNVVLKERSSEMIQYWSKRFNQICKSLRMFGLDGVPIKGKDDIDLRNYKTADQRATQGSLPFDIERATIKDYVADVTPFPKFQASISSVESDYRTKLAIAREVAEFINFEFYMDFTGEIIFKPPFYNLDVKPNPILNLRDEDIISWNISEDESQIYTRCDVYGNLYPAGEFDPRVSPLGCAIDQKLTRQYGNRQKTLSINWLNDARACQLYAVGWLDRNNAMRVGGSITIPGRPELRLGYPIYVPSRDAYYYVDSISHNLSVGSTFTTTVNVRGVRRKFSPPHIAKPYTASKEGIAKLRDSIEFKKGTPNVILTSTSWRQKRAIFKRNPNTGKLEDAIVDSIPDYVNTEVQQNSDVSVFGCLSGTFVYDQMPGQYFYRINQIKDYQRVQVKSKHFGFADYQYQPNFSYTTIIPVTDENGYDLIGMFPYGRNMEINRKGNVSFKSVSSLSTQVAAEKVRLGIANQVTGLTQKITNAFSSLSGNNAKQIAVMSPLDSDSEAELNYNISKEKLAINQMDKDFVARLTKEMKAGHFDRDNACQCWKNDADYINALAAKLTLFGG